MNVAATRSPARRYRAQRFRHRHREIYVSEFVDLSLLAPLAAAANESHETVQYLEGEQNRQIVAPLIFPLSLRAAQSASRTTARQTPHLSDGLQ
jgi:hypothetical protein